MKWSLKGSHGTGTVLSGSKEIRLPRFTPLAFACLLTLLCLWNARVLLTVLIVPDQSCTLLTHYPCGYPKSHCIHIAPFLLIVQPSQASYLHCLDGHLCTLPIHQQPPQALLHLHPSALTIHATLCSLSEPHTPAASPQPPVNPLLPLSLGRSHLFAC